MVTPFTAILQKNLTHPTSTSKKNQVIFWLTLSLTLSLIYSILGLQVAFSSEYVVQDDARQHVFWMQRFLDPELFPNDWIANYFQTVAPSGYTTLYRLIAVLGIHPLVFNKLLPMVLGLITTGYCFSISLQLLPVPATGFIASLILNQTLWMDDDLISGTPRAFVYPLLLAFLYYLLRRSLLPCLIAVALQGLFYPQTVFLSSGLLIVRLLSWEKGRVKLSSNLKDYRFSAAGLGVAFFILLPYALTSSQFEPIISATQAKTLPEFLPGGRAGFFNDNLWDFWIEKERSGLLPRRDRTPIILWIGLGLPLLLRYPRWLPLVKAIKKEIVILAQLMIVSVCLFLTAHAVLFKLHLPSRYMKYSLRIVLAISAAIALTLLLDAIFQLCHQPTRQVFALAITFFIGLFLIVYPSFLADFPKTNYTIGKASTLYQFFSQTPKDSLIASLSAEANNLPTFSARSVLVSEEYGIPYHRGYYRQFRQRAIDLINAQYSLNLAEVDNFIQKYGIDFLLLDRDAFKPNYIAKNSWINQFQPPAKKAQTDLKKRVKPALAKLIKPCSVFKTNQFIVLGADCIEKQ